MCNEKTVLIVEDEPLIARIIDLRLCNDGYHTLIANDGIEGVALAILNQPDVIVMDVRMPGKDGITSITELRENCVTQEIPVVVLSASLVDQAAALDAGARFFLTKPFQHKTLLAAVNTALTERKQSFAADLN